MRKPKPRPIDEFLPTSGRNRKSRKNRSKLFGILLLVAAVCIIGLMWYRLGAGPTPLEVYSLNDLSIEEVSEYLEMYPAGIFINDEEQGIKDTITSLTDFLALIPEADELVSDADDPFNNNLSLDTLTLIETGTPNFEEASSSENQPSFDEDKTIASGSTSTIPSVPASNATREKASSGQSSSKPEKTVASRETPKESAKKANSSIKAGTKKEFGPFEVEVSGERVEGIPLNFYIPSYSSRVSYFMDYGNGVTQRVKKRHAFSYTEPGNFTLKLIAIDQASGQRSAYTENIIIMPEPIAEQESFLDEGTMDETVDETASFIDEVEEDEPIPSEEMASPPQTGPSSLITGQEGDPLSDRGILKEEETPAELPDENSESIPAEVSGPLKIVEVLPSFPGGLSALNRFIQSEQQYPQVARENGIHGKVYLQFTVSESGKRENIKILRGIGYGCDEEALRLVSIMPDWVPGRHLGRVVPVLYTLPITFKLN
ncbi:MAG: TonB family protein [Bacteroidota bacterium]